MAQRDYIRIETERLLIRTLSMEDKEAFYKYRSMPEVYKYQSMRPGSINEVEEFISKNSDARLNEPDTWMQLAVCLMEGQMIGDIGIHFIDDKYQIEIGYTLSPEYQGRGYASEAANAIID